MIIIFLGVMDLYLPATTAAIHLGDLDEASPPNKEKLHNLVYFRVVKKEDDGKLYQAGTDKEGNQVFIVSVKGHPEVLVRSVQSLLALYKISPLEVRVIPCVPENPQVALLCRVLSLLGLANLANWLGLRLVNNRYPDLAKLSKA